MLREFGDEDDPVFLSACGRALVEGHGLEQNIEEGVQILRRAASGYSRACSHLGNYYSKIVHDDQEAVKCYENTKQARFLSILHYESELGLSKIYGTSNAERAVEQYKIAADGFNVEAQYRVAIAYEAGKGIGQDSHKAFTYFMLAARAGDDRAQYKVGVYLMKGLGIQRDIAGGKMWLTRAADDGDAESRRLLRQMSLQRFCSLPKLCLSGNR